MSNKTVIVTGASKGIGYAISQRLAAQGWRVIGISRTTVSGFPGAQVSCDLADVGQTEDVLQHLASVETVDAVVNNVGMVIPGALGRVELAALAAVFDLNVRTTLQVTQAFLESLKQRRGRVINISSRAVFGAVERSAYGAAKSAVVGLTRTWALELAPYGVTVNAIAPGAVETALFRRTRPMGSPEEQRVLASIPLRRIGVPCEVAATACFLLSEEAGFITGQVVCVDGGASLSSGHG